MEIESSLSLFVVFKCILMKLNAFRTNSSRNSSDTAQINNTHLEHYNTENNWFEDTHEKNYYIVLMLSSSINN